MSDFVGWIAAQAEPPQIGSGEGLRRHRSGPTEEELSGPGLPAHQFPGRKAEEGSGVSDPSVENELPHFSQKAREMGHPTPGAGNEAPNELPPQDELAQPEPEEVREQERERRIYRGRTVAMLRRYMRYSIEAGRLPSLMGSEFFRAKVTAYTVVTFEDRIIFVHDMETCLQRLDEFSRQLIARHVLQEHDRWATARLLQCNEKTVRRLTPLALDMLSEILLDVGLMERIESNSENSCQGGPEGEIVVSDCEDGENKF